MARDLARVAIRRVDRVGAVVLCNTSAGADPATLALDLIEASLDTEPPAVAPWRPGPPVLAELAPLIGRRRGPDALGHLPVHPAPQTFGS